MWCMGPKVGMGAEHHRYYKHTKFHQNPRGDPKFLVDLTWNDPYNIRVLAIKLTISNNVTPSLLPNTTFQLTEQLNSPILKD